MLSWVLRHYFGILAFLAPLAKPFFLFQLFIGFYNIIHKSSTVLFIADYPRWAEILLVSLFGGFATPRESSFAGLLDRKTGSSGSAELVVVLAPPPSCQVAAAEAGSPLPCLLAGLVAFGGGGCLCCFHPVYLRHLH